MSYWQKLFSDSLYIRVYLALFSLLLIGLFALPLIICNFTLRFWDLFGIVFSISMVLFGVYLLFMAVFATDREINKIGKYFDFTGADIVGVLFVCLMFIIVGIVAIPMTMVIRYFKPTKYF